MFTLNLPKSLEKILIVSLVLLAFATLAQAQTTVTIGGRFVYSGPDPAAPAANVTVTMTKKVFSELVSTQTSSTDGDGRYSVQVEARCDVEYKFVATSSEIVDGSPLPPSAHQTIMGCVTYDFTFPSPETDGAIQRPNPIILAGYVTDQFGAPIPAATVTLTRTKLDLTPNEVTITSTTTDENGHYVFNSWARCSVAIDLKATYGGVTFTPGITESGCISTSQGNLNLMIFASPSLKNAGKIKCREGVGRPVNVTNGNMYLEHRDFQVPGAGEAIDISRSYNSISQSIGLFGRGWTTQYDETVQINSNNQLELRLPDGRMVTPISPDFHGQIVRNANSTYTVSFKDGRVHHFNVLGQLASLIDRNGNQTVLTYSGGKLSSITDPFSRTLTVATNANGQVSSISDSLGTIATYTYGANKQLLTATYADNSKYQYSYVNVPSGLALSAVTDALGNLIEQHDYDSFGRATSSVTHGGAERFTLSYTSFTETDVTDGLGRLTKYFYTNVQGRNVVTQVDGLCGCGGPQVQTWTYDSDANVTTHTDALDRTRSFTYDGSGNRLTETDATGTVSYTYNQFSELLTRTDQSNGVTTNTFDGAGNLLSITDALNKTTSFTYDAKGQLLTAKDARNNITTLTWDTSGRLTQIKDAANNSKVFTYDARARLLTATNALNFMTRFAYDAAGRINKITKPDNSFVTFTYDLAGRRTRVADALNNNTNFAYDGAYRLTSVTDAALKTTSYTYDLMSNLTGVTDALGRTTNIIYDDFNRPIKMIHAPAVAGATRLEATIEYDAVGNATKRTDTAGRITTLAYDDSNRLISVTNPLLQITQYEYDARSNQTAVVDALNHRHTFDYDALGQLISATRAGVTMSFVYDGVGNRIQRTNYNNMTTNYSYDELNRLTSITYPDASTVTYGYDKLSQMTSATNVNGTVRFTYDGMGRAASTTDVWGQTLNYTYDANDRRTKMSFGTATLATYTYDTLNRLTKITDSGNKAINYGYDVTSKVTSRALPNGVTTTYSYDGLDRLTRLKDAKGNTVVVDNQYSYNNAGNITRNIDQGGTHNYTYDLVGRLISAIYTGAPNESYTYDAVGNRTSSHKSPTYAYQPFNRLTGTNTASYLYDDDGKMSAKTESAGTTLLAWDFENRLTQTVTPGSGGVTYKYDALGRRIQSVPSSGASINFTYDGLDVVQDKTSAGVVTEYLNGPGVDNKIRQKSGTTFYYFAQDHLGSITALTDSKGALLERLSYDSYGNNSGSTRTRYGYTGREREQLTGLLYYRARFYDPQLGRFISEDPIGFGGGDTNLYGYVWQNPLSFRDPMGLDGWGNDFADWLDRNIEAGRRYLQSDPHAVNFNTIVNYAANVYHGTADLLRVGNGVGNAIYRCPDDPFGEVLKDIGRASSITLMLAGPAAGVASSGSALGRGALTTRGSPSFLGQEAGPAIAIPEGASGPVTLANGRGIGYTGGSGGNGLAPSVSNVRIMNPTPPRGPSPGYPNGYVNYRNGAVPTPQSVNPVTGQTIGRSNPWWHIPLGR